jgi:hypothetical protein
VSWLEALLARGNEAKAEAPVVVRQEPIDIDEPCEIKHVTVQTSGPDGNYPGSVMVGHYAVHNGFVVMRDESGKPTGQRMAAERIRGRWRI